MTYMRCNLHISLFTALLLGALTMINVTHAAPKASTAAKTNAPVAAEVAMVVPKSHFGTELEGGKDPFYPGSARFQRKVSVTPTNQVAVAVLEVSINGFSGNAARPLVIINNLTFGEGDEQMVTTTAGRAKVRCIAIRRQDQSVEIEINGQRRELRFQERK